MKEVTMENLKAAYLSHATYSDAIDNGDYDDKFLRSLCLMYMTESAVRYQIEEAAMLFCSSCEMVGVYSQEAMIRHLVSREDVDGTWKRVLADYVTGRDIHWYIREVIYEKCDERFIRSAERHIEDTVHGHEQAPSEIIRH